GEISGGGGRHPAGRWQPGGRHPATFRERAAGAGGQHLDREIGKDRGTAEEERDSVPGAERETARARGENYRAGGAEGRGDRLDEHGRARNRYFIGRESGSDDARILPEEQAGDAVCAGGGRDRRGGGGGNTGASGCGERREWNEWAEWTGGRGRSGNRDGRGDRSADGALPTGGQDLSGAAGSVEADV